MSYIIYPYYTITQSIMTCHANKLCTLCYSEAQFKNNSVKGGYLE